jgi:hypothetical protein
MQVLLTRNNPTVHLEQIALLFPSSAHMVHPETNVSHRRHVFLLKKYKSSHKVQLAVSLPSLVHSMQLTVVLQDWQILLFRVRKLPLVHLEQLALSVPSLMQTIHYGIWLQIKQLVVLVAK